MQQLVRCATVYGPMPRCSRVIGRNATADADGGFTEGSFACVAACERRRVFARSPLHLVRCTLQRTESSDACVVHVSDRSRSCHVHISAHKRT